MFADSKRANPAKPLWEISHCNIERAHGYFHTTASVIYGFCRPKKTPCKKPPLPGVAHRVVVRNARFVLIEIKILRFNVDTKPVLNVRKKWTSALYAGSQLSKGSNYLINVEL